MKRKINRIVTTIATAAMLFTSYGPQFVYAEGEDQIISEEIVSEDEVIEDD